MIIKCISNKGEYLRGYEYKKLNKDVFGRFGASGYTEYAELQVGKEYLVMGIVIFESHQGYLIDDDEFITIVPCQLFKILDSSFIGQWYYRLIEKDEENYPFIQAIFGYYEFCFDKKSYQNLIIEKDEESIQTYFQRKKKMMIE